MKHPVDHVARALLPWRPEEAGLTECGLPAASYPTISREAFLARVKELGQQRAAILTCMTCWNTARSWKPWEEDPASAMHREAGKAAWDHGEAGERFRRELRAIAALIEAHREEFDATLKALAEIPILSAERRKRRS